MSGLSRFDEFSNEEALDMDLILKKMDGINVLLGHYRYFCEKTEFGDEVIETVYAFSKYLGSLGYGFYA